MPSQLVALDIDGTLLNSRKEIPEDALQAIRRVTAEGVTVAFATGRAVPELQDLITRLPEIRYAIVTSGAGIYDIREKRFFGLRPIPPHQVRRILALARRKDIMPQLALPEIDVIQASHMAHLEDFQMNVYRPMYEKAMTLVPDIYAWAENCREPSLKINLYHRDVPERVLTRQELECDELELVYSEITSVECSAAGVSKGSGLEELCRLLGIPKENSLAVGDADNDLPMLRSAGVSIAMGNAPLHVKKAATRVVSDLDHGGCAQAVLMAL